LAVNLAHTIVLRRLGPIIQLRARFIFVNCCYPCHFLCLDLPDKSSDQELDRCAYELE